MLQRGQTDPDGWIHSSQLAFKPYKLPEEDIQPFLDSLLTDIATRPAKLRLRETAAVVRFLLFLASQGVPTKLLDSDKETVAQYRSEESVESREARSRLENLAGVIWSVLRQTGDLPTADRETALQFLERHRTTYLDPYDVTEAIDLIETLRLRPDAEDPFVPPHLISRTTTSTGQGNPYLGSDLTQKIYIAFHFLKRHKVKGADGVIVKKLNELRVKHERKEEGWDYPDINDKVKQQRKRLREELEQTRAEESTDEEAQRKIEEATQRRIKQRTDFMVDLQITSFLGQRDLARQQEERERLLALRRDLPKELEG